MTLPGRLPLEELLFFLVIPVCAVLTLEAVRTQRPDWLVGDEPVAALDSRRHRIDRPTRPPGRAAGTTPRRAGP